MRLRQLRDKFYEFIFYTESYRAFKQEMKVLAKADVTLDPLTYFGMGSLIRADPLAPDQKLAKWKM